MVEYNAHKFVRHIFVLHGSVAPKIIWRVLFFAGWSATVLVFHRFVRPVEVPSTVHTLVGVALGLLLVFRTNASYERFWEGRKLWGGIVNESRNLARITSAFLRERPSLIESIILWAAAFPYASMHSLRGTASLGPLAARLPEADVAETLAATHVPLSVARRISGSLAEARAAGHLTDYVAVAIDSNVQQLVDYLGACERIQKTPLPFAYVVHLRRALVLYCLTLPFVLVGPFSWSTIIYTMMISYILFGIEEIGVEIENPFGTDYNDLPLEEICATIERDLLAVVEVHHGPALVRRGAGA
jgi:Predicted membrane protein